MRTLIGFEIAKLLRRPIAVFALLVLFLLTWFSAFTDSYMSETTVWCAAGECVYGMEATAKNKQTAAPYEGVLTDETIAAIIRNYRLQETIDQVEQKAKAAAQQGEAYYYTEIPEQAGYDYDAASTLVMHQFMEITADGDVRIRPVSDYANGRPLIWESSDFWDEMIYDSGTSCVTLLFIVIILFAPVFAMERRMDTSALILVSQHGRKKDAFARILACAIILLVLYALIHTVLFMVNLIKFGPSGGAVSAALAGFSLEAHTAMSMRELLALQLGMGLLAVWFVSAVTILLSSFLSSAKTWAVLFLAGSLWFMASNGYSAWQIVLSAFQPLQFARCADIIWIGEQFLPGLLALLPLLYVPLGIGAQMLAIKVWRHAQAR